MEERSPATLAVAPEWIEHHCVVPDGFRYGEPFRLYDWQLRYLSNFYLVRGEVEFHRERPILGPAFVHRRGLLVGPQGIGKSPGSAAHVTLEAVGPALFAGWASPGDGYACADHGCGCGWEYEYEPGEPKGMPWPTPLIQLTARSEDQVDNIYGALRPMIEEGPLADIIPAVGEAFIRLPGGGRIDVVTASALSRIGQRTTFVLQTEVGVWTPQNKMTKVADAQYRNLAKMGGRASLETNAWDPAEQSVAQQQFESAAIDVYRQYVEPPRTLSYGNKRERAKIHRIVYPREVLRENGGHLDLASIENDAADLAERDLPQAARFYGNIRMAGAGRAVDPDVWDDLILTRRYPGGKPPPGTYIGIGGDGSISDDATFLRGCTRDGFSFLIGKWIRPPGPRGRGWTVPRLDVDQALRDALATWRVGRVYFDPPKWWSEIKAWQREHGETLVLEFDTNQDRRMAPAVDAWLTAITTAAHTHDGDPDTSRHVKNAAKRKAKATAPDDDNRTLYTLTKPDDGGKIDGAVADVLAYAAAMSMPDQPPPDDADRTLRFGGYR